jgi:uncharacterized protein (DUF1501 family)
MSFDRRNFLKTSALASCSMLVPQFLKAFEAHAKGTLINANQGKILVVVQLSGGNDGLNTIIPYTNDLYYSLRPKLSIPKDMALRLTDESGMHPELGGLKNLYDQGYLSIINNVGYPNPNRSHFRSMDIWQSASEANQNLNTGWLGRYLDNNCQMPYQILEMDDVLSLALKGEKMNGIAATDLNKLYKNTDAAFLKTLNATHTGHDNEAVSYLYKTLAETYLSADYLYKKKKQYSSSIAYDKNEFAQHLRTIAELVITEANCSVYYVTLPGFDTHNEQKGKQAKLLKNLGDGLNSFVTDLKQNNKFKDVAVMVFSEFGRRVTENASNGTDHGTANVVMVLNENLKKQGLYNAPADLLNLENEDLKFSVDFRQIYSSLLERWLGVNARQILGGHFEGLGFV